MTQHTPSSPSRPYVLGTGDDELSRLSLQHRLWSDAAAAAWKSAAFGPGRRILDIGCGPGFASFDLAQLVTSGGEGRVVGVDESANFIEHLNAQARARVLPQLTGVVGDVQKLVSLGLAPGSFDGAYARWVLCFVPDPEAVIAGAAGLVRSGVSMVIHDYFNYTTMTAAPRLASHDRLVAATAASWRGRGGDPDICGRLPAMLNRHGFELRDIRVHQRLARGGGNDPMMAWPITWWNTYAPKLVAMGSITQAQCDEALADLAAIERDHTRFVVCPPVYELIAMRR